MGIFGLFVLLASCTVHLDSEIASALNINEDEVEGVIIRAIGLKLLSARVDQVKKTVRVGYVVGMWDAIDIDGHHLRVSTLRAQVIVVGHDSFCLLVGLDF